MGSQSMPHGTPCFTARVTLATGSTVTVDLTGSGYHLVSQSVIRVSRDHHLYEENTSMTATVDTIFNQLY